MDDAVTVSSPGELVGLVPHVLGFRPAESMVCVPFGNAPVAQVHLPTWESDVPLGELTWPTSMAGSAVRRWRWLPSATTHTEPCRQWSLSSTRSAPAGSFGPVLWVRGDEWTDLTTVTRGRVSPGTVSLMGAEFAVRGRVMPTSSPGGAGGRALRRCCRRRRGGSIR